MPQPGDEIPLQGASGGSMLDSGHCHQYHQSQLTAIPNDYNLYRQEDKNSVKE
jgi:hypothetical protein